MNIFRLSWLVGLLLIVLKLCQVIAWSWLWVLFVFWFPAAAIAAAVVSVGFFVLARMAYKKATEVK